MAGSGLFSRSTAVKAHLTQPGSTGGVAAEVAALRRDLAVLLSPLAAIVVEEFTDVATANADGIVEALATTTGTQTLTGAALDGVVGGATMSPPRNLTVTTDASPATWQNHVHVTGLDVFGRTQTEQFLLENDTVKTGTKMFAKVTSVVVDPQVDANGTITVGFGALIGLSRPIKSRTGGTVFVREVVNGSLVTNGVASSSSTNVPCGAYAPNSAPNGTNDYCVYYEEDATSLL